MKKLYSVLTDDLEHCYITGSNTIAIHHVFGGPDRKVSERYGFLVPLRPDWHNLSSYGVHQNRELDLRFKRLAQGYYEDHIGSREQFRQEFGRNYLD